MKIQFITPIYVGKNNLQIKQNSGKNQNTTTNINNKEYKAIAYKDYNISFGARTPENFYAQTFNRENMPHTMKEYLNYDYETRQHIPPEQMMQEVFQYIDIAENFNEVKDIYPNEPLFKNLHENNQKNRSSILWEIKTAKELSDEPLLKDGSDNFGMYLLKKIYLEGKTIKEINKDFYDKDMNKAYSGIIAKPIDKEITSAYGIKYPKSAFWNSFIATREEYKKFFVTLPKNTVKPGVNINNIKNENINQNKEIETSKSEQYKPKTRKYKIKNYHKKQITNDIKDANGDKLEIEKKIRRRFAKNDPEASFIVKYLSPIMAIAADRVHLSEEMRAFCEDEREHGKTSEDKYMFKRFWKQNPHILDYYAQTITDTIDLFEEVYGEGGLIPINKDLEIIKPETENKKVIDKVSHEFIELLNYTQTILPERENKYAIHNKLQQDWEEHFENRYGKVINEVEEINQTKEVPEKVITDYDEFFNQMDEKFYKEAIKEKSKIYPSLYANKYIKYMSNNKNIDKDYKQAYSLYVQEPDIEYTPLPKEKFMPKYYEIETDFITKSKQSIEDSIRAKLAIMELLSKHGFSNYKMYFLNSFEIYDFAQESDTSIIDTITTNKKELNDIYTNLQIKLKPNEVKTISKELLKQLKEYDSNITFNNNGYSDCCEPNLYQILKMMKEACKNPIRCKLIEKLLVNFVNNYPYAKAILNQNLNKDEKRAIFENIMYQPILDLLDNNRKDATLILLIGEENLQKYIVNTDKNIKMALISQIQNITDSTSFLFKFKHSDYLKDYEENPKACEKKYNNFELK